MPKVSGLIVKKQRFKPTKFRAWDFDTSQVHIHQKKSKELSNGNQSIAKELSKIKKNKSIEQKLRALSGYQLKIFKLFISTINEKTISENKDMNIPLVIEAKIIDKVTSAAESGAPIKSTILS